jgi:hypothetical protein
VKELRYALAAFCIGTGIFCGLVAIGAVANIGSENQDNTTGFYLGIGGTLSLAALATFAFALWLVRR